MPDRKPRWVRGYQAPRWFQAALMAVMMTPCAWLVLYLLTMIPIVIYDSKLADQLQGPGRRDGTRVPSWGYYIYQRGLLAAPFAAGVAFAARAWPEINRPPVVQDATAPQKPASEG